MAGGRRGQHQAQVLTLNGKKRAAGIDKCQEAQLFAKWLRDHPSVSQMEPPYRPRIDREDEEFYMGVLELAAK